MRLGAPVFEIEGGMAGTLEIFHADAWGSVCSNVLLRRSSTDTVVWPCRTVRPLTRMQHHEFGVLRLAQARAPGQCMCTTAAFRCTACYAVATHARCMPF